MKKIIIPFSIAILAAAISACIPSPPKPGFRIKTFRTTIVSGSPVPTQADAPGISVEGNVTSVFCCVQILGNVGAFSGTTNGDAYYDVPGGKTPATWRLGENNGPCAAQSVSVNIINQGVTQPLNCRDVPITFFTFLPSTIERDSPPGSITIDGNSMSSDGGMPTVEYYDLNGTLVAQDTASTVSYDGTELTAPVPNVSLFASGAYVVVVRNADGNSPGNGVMVIFDYIQPPPDPPPDPGGCGESGDCIVY